MAFSLKPGLFQKRTNTVDFPLRQIVCKRLGIPMSAIGFMMHVQLRVIDLAMGEY